MAAHSAMPGSTGRMEARPATALHGRALAVARGALAVVATLAVALSAAGQPALYAQFRALAMYDPAIRETVRANLGQLGLAVDLYAAYLLALGIILALVCFAIAAIIVWRRSDEPMALFVALLLVLLGATFSGAIGAPGDRSPVMTWLDSILSALSLETVILCLYLFPDGRFVPRWTRWPAGLSLLAIVPASLVPGVPASPERWPDAVYGLFLTAMLLSGVVAQIYRYRRISAAWQRQQTKWIVLGFALAIGGYLTVGLLPAVVPSLQPGTVADLIGAGVVAGCMLLIPLCFGIAILRYHLWDIDVVINRALVYGALTGLLVTVYLVGVVLLQALFRILTGQASTLAIVIATLGAAALFQPLRQRLQTAIDRRFYRRKYDAGRTLAVFSAHLRDEVDLARLTETLVQAVDDTMQPRSLSLWLQPPRRRGQ
jgi:hypothetical protein